MAKKMYTGVQSYIQSTGSQYIQTNVVAKAGIKVIMDISFDEIPSSTTYFFGNNYSSSLRYSLCIYSNGNWGISRNGSINYSQNSSYAPTVGTRYKIEAYFGASSQYLKVNGTQVLNPASTLTDEGSQNLSLFNQIRSAGTIKMKLYSCSLYYNDALVADYVPNGNGVYDNVARTQINAGTGTFTQGTSTSRLVKNLYLGVGGVAKKVKKVYIGVGGIAKQIYPSYTLIPFTANPIPTGWSGKTTTEGAEFSISDSYGTWKCSANKKSSSSTYITWKVFDGSTSTYYRTSSYSANPIVTLFLPTGISINPTKLLLRLYYCGTGTKVEGRIEETDTWEQIYATTSGTTSATSYTPTVSVNNYYDAFRVVTTTQSSSYYQRIYELQLTTGTIKDNR